MSDSKPTAPVAVAALGGILAIVGTLLSWITVKIELGEAGSQSFSANGLKTSDGKIAIVAAIILLIAAGGMRAGKTKGARRGLAILAVIAGLAAGGVAILNIATAERQKSDALDEASAQIASSTGLTAADVRTELEKVTTISLAFGIYITAAGGVIGLIGGIMGIGSAGKMSDETATPAAPGGSGWAPSGEPPAGGTTPPPAPPPPATPPPPPGGAPSG